MRRSVLLIAAVLAAALAALVAVGASILDRDRRELYERHARDRLHVLEAASRVLERDLAEVVQDLALAAALLDNVGSDPLAERELRAIATLKREYLLLETRRAAGPDAESRRVLSLDAPPGLAAAVAPAVADALARATRARDQLVISGPLRSGPLGSGPLGSGPLGAGPLGAGPLGAGDARASWYRVFARWPAGHDHAIAVVLDASVLLARVDMLRDPTSRLFVVGEDGRRTLRPGPLPAALHPLVDAARAAGTAVTVLDPRDPAAAEIAPEMAVAVAAIVRPGAGLEPWTIVRVNFAGALRVQERVLLRRLIVGGALALGLLLASAAYVLYNTRRAAALRERLRHADRLAHLTEKAEKILDHIPSGVLALSEELRITATNRWLDARLPRPVIGERLGAAFAHAPSAHVEALEALVAAARAEGAARSLHRERLALFGADALVNVHAIPLARAVADVSALVVIEDLTALRRIEERLVHSEKLVMAGQLAAGIAHEIGTPLNVVRGRAELALSRLGAEHPQAPSQRVIIDQIDRVTRLLQQLLDYVRPGAAELRAVEVAPAIERTAELLAAQAGQRGVALAVDARPGLPAIRADADQLQQVLVNLVMNALDACERGGRVAVRARPERGGVVVEVADDGPGIPHEIRPHVFDPFFTTKKRGQGTGLGLWVVAQLVRAHGAEIELVTEPGAGTVVRVTWPAAEPAAPADLAAPASTGAAA